MTSRGLTDQEYLELYGRDDSPVWVGIVSFGTGWIKVELQDGRIQLRENGSVSWRYNNPGNLKYGKFSRMFDSIGPGWGNHAVFPNRHIGQMAKKALLFSSESYRDLTLLQAINRYAPSSDTGQGVPIGGNQPSKYVTYICRNASDVKPNDVMWTFDDHQKDQILKAMQTYEGFKPGNVSFA